MKFQNERGFSESEFLIIIVCALVFSFVLISLAYSDWRDEYEAVTGFPVFDLGHCGCSQFDPVTCPEHGQYDPSLCKSNEYACQNICFHDNQFVELTPTPAPTSADHLCRDVSGLYQLDGWWGHDLRTEICPAATVKEYIVHKQVTPTPSGPPKGWYQRIRSAAGTSVIKSVVVDPSNTHHLSDMRCFACSPKCLEKCISDIEDSGHCVSNCPLPDFDPNGIEGAGSGSWAILTVAFEPTTVSDADDITISIWEPGGPPLKLAETTLSSLRKHLGACWGCKFMNTKFYFWDIHEIYSPTMYIQFEWDDDNQLAQLHGWSISWIQAHLEDTQYWLDPGDRLTLDNRFCRGDSSWADGENDKWKKIGLISSYIIDWGDGEWSLQYAHNSSNKDDRNWHDYNQTGTYYGRLYVIHNSIDYEYYPEWDIEVWDSIDFEVHVATK